MASDLASNVPAKWLRAKLRSLAPVTSGDDAAALLRAAAGSASGQADRQFANPFTLNDLLVFDAISLRHVLMSGALGGEELGLGLHGASREIVDLVRRAVP